MFIIHLDNTLKERLCLYSEYAYSKTNLLGLFMLLTQVDMVESYSALSHVVA